MLHFNIPLWFTASEIITLNMNKKLFNINFLFFC